MPKVLSSVLNNNSFTISFRTNNKLLDILKPKKHTPPEEKTGIYKLTCNDCECFYIGQTGRGLLKRIREHLPKKIRNIDNIKSNYARHPVSYTHLDVYKRQLLVI